MNASPEPRRTHVMSVKEARLLFLEALDQVEPEILRKLRDEVFPYFDSDTGLSWLTCREDPSYESLREALESWADEFNIASSWIFQAALRNLWVWFVADPSDIAGPDLIWHHDLDLGSTLTHRDDLASTSMPLSWDPARESPKAFRERALTDFERMLDRYIERKKKTQALRTGATDGPLPLFAPLRWLALHRAKGLSPEAIAALYDERDDAPDPGLIQDALSQAEEMLR